MRELTEAEALALRVLLAANRESERDRLNQTQLPRSTYHAVRKRAYEEGWLRDRYIPDPLLYGFTHATFALARPYADRQEELVRAWSAEPGCVLLWRSSAAVFAVLLQTSAARAASCEGRLRKAELATEVLILSPPLKDPSVPVYFDYEGLFANMAGISGTSSYPRGLGGPASVGARRGGGPVSSEGLRRTTQELLARPFTSERDGRAGHLVGPVGLPRSQRRLVEHGWVERRVLPDPARIPPFQGRAADMTAFVRGRFLAGHDPQGLLPVLTEQCRVYPFLLVFQEGQMLMAAQGQSPVGPGQSVTSVAQRRPVLPTLQEHLQSIEVTQVRAAEIAPMLDHRYDALLASPAPPVAVARGPAAR